MEQNQQQLFMELQYQISCKRDSLKFATHQNNSRVRDLGNRIELESSRLKTHAILFIALLIVGAVFAFFVSIGHSMVTMVFGLIYLINAVVYLSIMLPFFVKIMELFMRWLENSDTEWGNAYCHKRKIFTMAMERTECARQSAKYQNYLKILDEIDEELTSNASTGQLENWLQRVSVMELEPEVPRGKVKNTREENIKYVFCLLFVMLVFLIIVF